ncbi:hypothetical protein CMV_013811 [Castanea mollissima]|uniref:Uncharacterized protein n=1 Tax=Castanea mollissima TaxID=60419 RepID=A0A8J4VUI6_9ROSI|nr:hypothetical protein CMV_013811 [Castanea mollissima]
MPSSHQPHPCSDRMGMSLKTKTHNSHDHQIRYQNRLELVGFGSYLCFSAKMLVERDFDLVAKEKNDTSFVENLSKSGGHFVRSSDGHALARLNELRVSDNLFALHTKLSLQRFHVHYSHQPPLSLSLLLLLLLLSLSAL